MPVLNVLWSALTSKLAGPLASLIAVSLAIALSVSAIQKAELRREVTSAQNTVGQLKGSLEFQNMAVQDLGNKSAQAAARAQGAIEASRAAHAGDAAAIAALVSKPVQTDPLLACSAADAAILGATR